MPSICAVADCPNTTYHKQENKELIHHGFPVKHELLCKKWTHFCKRNDKLNSKTARICSDHFRPEDYRRDMEHELLQLPPRKRLKSDAVPTINRATNDQNEKRVESRKRRYNQRERREMIDTILKDVTYSSIVPTEVNETEVYNTNELIVQAHDLSAQVNLTRDFEDKIFMLEIKLASLTKTLTEKDKVVLRLRKQNTRLRNSIFKVRHKIPSSQHSSSQQRKYKQWKTEEIVRALSVRSVGLKAYETARKVLSVPLPSVSTLRRWSGNFSCDEGLLLDVLAVMKSEAKSMDIWKRLCALSFDEVSISSDYIYDKKINKIMSHSKAQVIMARGICDSWKQPIFYAFDQSITKDLLHKIICYVEKAGYLVYSITSDLGADNRSLWKALNITTENTTFQNPYDMNRKIFVFADVPHLLKLIRNHLLDDRIVLSNELVINRGTFEEIVTYDDHELKLCPKITHKHLEVTGAERMRVRPAAQLLSNHTAALADKVFPENTYIGEFIRLVNNAFDVMNSRIPNDTNPIKSSYGTDIIRQKTVLQQFTQVMQSSRFLLKSGKKKRVLLPCQTGFIVSMKSTIGLFDAISSLYKLPYILTSRLNQDSLESLFSTIRSFGGPNVHPSPPEFKYRLRLILLGSQLPAPKGTNSIYEDNTNVMSANLLQKNNLLKAQGVSTVSLSLPPTTKNRCYINQETIDDDGALQYLAGYIAWKIKRRGKGIYGKPTMSKANSSWIATLSRGGLLTPSDTFYDWVKILNSQFQAISREIFSNGVTKKFQELVTRENPDIPLDVLKEFIAVRLRIREKYLNVCKHPQVSSASSLNKRKNLQFVKSGK